MTALPLCLLAQHKYGKRDSHLRKPIEVGRFSLDGRREFHHDRRKMSCIVDHVLTYKHPIRLDLNDGFEDRFIARDENVKERLNNLLRWMLINKERFVNSSHGLTLTQKDVRGNIIGEFPDFMLWRGHLTKIMCTPYENRDGWVMACQKICNTIYISEVETEEAAVQRQNRSDRERWMTYWGVRFEGYMTKPFSNPTLQRQIRIIDQSKVVTKTNSAFCSVLRSRLNEHHSLVYGAEVDCCKPVEILNPPDCYIELKTNRKFTTKRQQDNFYRFKALKWWAQSYLAGIPLIVCGFRNDHGFVESIEHFSISELSERAANIYNSWNPNHCLSFLDSLLTSVKELFQKEQMLSHSVLLLKWNPGDEVISYSISINEEDRFLPHWFVENITS